MEQMKCPGQDTRFWKPEDIFVMECPKCGAEIEFFKDDARRRCAWCGHLFYNPKIELGCAEWCQYAEKCVPELMKEKRAAQTFKEALVERLQSLPGGEGGTSDEIDQGLKLATDLLKAEGGDPKVVIAAVLLHRLSPEQARELLTEIETEPEFIDEIVTLLARGGAEADLNRKLFLDAVALLQAKPEAIPQFHTRTGQRLAEEGR